MEREREGGWTGEREGGRGGGRVRGREGRRKVERDRCWPNERQPALRGIDAWSFASKSPKPQTLNPKPLPLPCGKGEM